MLLATLPSDPISLLIWLVVICAALYIVFNLLPAGGWPSAGASGRWGFPIGNLLYLLIVVVVVVVILHLLFSLL